MKMEKLLEKNNKRAEAGKEKFCQSVNNDVVKPICF